ncbi:MULTISPECIES: hypothetical protein [unclassified Sinorhizobium]|uniref:hypothetical protein n=1 Tax=unclassified Sinorhizobium TaxID=2613772 RepID=UPI003524B0D6
MKPDATKSGGLFVAPAIWAINTQLGLMLPYADCGSATYGSIISTFTAFLMAAASASISFRGHAHASRTSLFIMRLSVLVGLAFAFALILQGAATLLISPCEH